MSSFLPGLAFAAPWALGLLALLPLLWRLLRVVPPSPRRVRFPALRLLLGLQGQDDPAEAIPPWLLVLRIALAAAVILAVARPLLHPVRVPPPAEGAVLVVIDDGHASARDWPARRAALETRLGEAERAGRPVLLLTTAAPADGTVPGLSRLMPAAEARAAVAGLEPKPWATDRLAALAALDHVPDTRIGRGLWLSDGLAGPGAQELMRRLQALAGGLDLVSGRAGRHLLPPAEDSPPDRLVVTVRRLPAALPERVTVRGLDATGTVLAREDSVLEAGQGEVKVAITLPADLRNRLVRLDLDGERGAAATVLLDQRWQRRSVGLVGGGRAAGSPLLDPLHYIERALAPHSEIRRGELADLLGDDGPEVLILANQPLGPGPITERLEARLARGGVLIRFAGPLMADAPATGEERGRDPLLPVPLRHGGRAVGGVMSWTNPMKLGALPETGPFHGMPVPADVEVKAQLLAEPSLDLASQTCASLSDGTPLITARRSGAGWVVLVHTTANAEWSNLALSGLFVDMLRRLAGLGRGGRGVDRSGPLAPAELLDGFGRLVPPSGLAEAIAQPQHPPRPGPRHPPGFYAAGDGRMALNLSPSLDAPRPLLPPSGVTLSGMDGPRSEIDLGPALLVLAVLLALADGLASLWLRGMLGRALPFVLPAVLLMPIEAAAAESFALDAALSTRLACLRTHDPATDRDCLAGLRGLSAAISRRSTASLAEPMMVDAERDPVVFFPLLYWRVAPAQPPLPAAATDKLNAYMARGGMLVVDTGAAAEPGSDARQRLRVVVQGLALPPLIPLTSDHVVNRAFYLLKESPGRWEGSAPWVEQPNGGGGNDDVSAIIVGDADWIGAWAVDAAGRPLHAVVPGGERQREMSIRFGVNLVMYALTGNYKADQVHLPAIMERLGR